MFVDVGGGSGHQCVDLRKAFPDIQGRVIVQDLEYPISTRLEYASVEGMVHDAFKPQPIEGSCTLFTAFLSRSSGLTQKNREILQTENAFLLTISLGARFYYLRTVLHDWTDEHCVSILINLKDAMNLRSRILIDELVLPDQGVDWTATALILL